MTGCDRKGKSGSCEGNLPGWTGAVMGSSPDPRIPVCQLKFTPTRAGDLVINRGTVEKIRYRNVRFPLMAEIEVGDIKT